MKISFIFLCLLCSNSSISQKHKIIDNDTILSWSASRKLTWDDFKAKKDPNRYGLNDAMTIYKLEILPETVLVDEEDRIQGHEKMDIVTYFFKKKSWTVKRKDMRLLVHEQLHFDIAELFARKMRKEFYKLKKNKVDTFSAYQSVYTTLWKSCRMYQKQYDDETKHSRDLVRNEKWVEKIYKELQLLEEYSYTYSGK